MYKNLAPVKEQINKLANIKISDEMLRKADLQALLPKISEVVQQLDYASASLSEMNDQGSLKRFWKSLTGSNDRILANAEQSLINSSKMTIGLTLLSTLYAKAIKEQQDQLAQHQRTLQDQNEKLEAQQHELRRVIGISKEQAKMILEILSGREELAASISANLSEEVNQFTGQWEYRLSRLQEEIGEYRVLISDILKQIRLQNEESKRIDIIINRISEVQLQNFTSLEDKLSGVNQMTTEQFQKSSQDISDLSCRLLTAKKEWQEKVGTIETALEEQKCKFIELEGNHNEQCKHIKNELQEITRAQLILEAKVVSMEKMEAVYQALETKVRLLQWIILGVILAGAAGLIISLNR